MEPEQADPAPSQEASKDSGGDKTGTPETRGAESERGSRPGRGASVLAVVALIFALIALAGIGALGWSWYQLRGEQARVAQLEGRVSGLSGRLASLGNTAASERSVSKLAAQLQSFQETESKRNAAMEKTLQALSGRLAGAGKSYREDEAASLMRLAQAKLELQSDPVAAAQALKLADQALVAADDPALAPVRTILAKEITALEAVPRPDVTGAYTKLAALAARVNALPLAGEAVPTVPAAGTAASGFSWRGLGAAFKRAFSPLIVVRHGVPARPLLPPRETWFVRENMKLVLANAQLALLERDDTAWRASLGRAHQWLQDWFLAANPEVKSALATLDGLRSLELSPQVPALGAALSELNAVRAATAATK